MVRPLRRWILLADTLRAHVVEIVGESREARTMANLVFRNDFMPCAKPTEDRPAGASDRVERERHFAVRVLTEISSHAAEDAFDQLVIAAPPGMLRHLRNAMPLSMAELIGPEIESDLTHVPADCLVQELSNQVFRLH